MLQEFKAFAMKGSVIDLAVGVIIGAAFGKIITSLVDDVIMPLFGIFLRGADFSKLALTVGDAHINYGLFIQSVVNFVIVTFCIFFIIKQANRFKKPVPVTSPTTPEDVVLLREIRDELKKRHA